MQIGCLKQPTLKKLTRREDTERARRDRRDAYHPSTTIDTGGRAGNEWRTMKTACTGLILWLILGGCATPAPRWAPVRVGPFLGAEPALHFEAPGAGVAAVCLPSVAGRIVHFSLNGEKFCSTKGGG